MGVHVAEKKDGPTPEQLAKGGYSRKFVMHVESATETAAHVSRHDPVERWKSADPPRLEPHQLAAIELCQRLWRTTEDKAHEKLIATYGERWSGKGSREMSILALRDAEQQLRRIQDHFAGLGKWWDVFEAVCRQGEPAGTAGSRLGYGSTRAADVRAHQCVCFVADIIATKERL